MALSQRNDSLVADWVRLRELAVFGNPEQALRLAEQVITDASDPFRVAQALIGQLVLFNNSGNRDNLPPLLKQAEEQLRAAPHPRLIGEYHSVAAAIAQDRRAYGLALLHIVSAERALERMEERTRAAVGAWHDLAEVYSRLGYHGRAVQAGERAQSLSAEIGEPPLLDTAFIATVQAAVYLDQRGDTAGCVRALTNLVERSRPHAATPTLGHQVAIGYAVRRLAALDHPVTIDVPAARQVGPFLNQINILGDVCDAVAGRRPDRALAILDAPNSPLDALGIAEALRLRSLALAQLGDYAGALAAERSVLLVLGQAERDLGRLLADSVGARIDQDQLRQNAETHARAALTDHLTGLPNRRKIDDFAATLTEMGQTATLGMLDLDKFKAINDYHGHPTGDIVLQRIAGILAREVQPTDLVARQGGDEFVVVLPGTTRNDAAVLGERIEAAISNEDWSTLVPDTPVAISIGWAELTSDLHAAFRAADAALYEAKGEHYTRSEG